MLQSNPFVLKTLVIRMKSVFLKIPANILIVPSWSYTWQLIFLWELVKICEYTFYVNSSFFIVDQSYALIFTIPKIDSIWGRLGDRFMTSHFLSLSFSAVLTGQMWRFLLKLYRLSKCHLKPSKCQLSIVTVLNRIVSNVLLKSPS